MAIKRIFFAGFATIFLASGLTACSYNDNAASVQNKTMQTEDTTVIQQNKETEAFNESGKTIAVEEPTGAYPYDSIFPQHEPYGTGIGAMPGRVVWAYDTLSVRWDGTPCFFRIIRRGTRAAWGMPATGVAYILEC